MHQATTKKWGYQTWIRRLKKLGRYKIALDPMTIFESTV